MKELEVVEAENMSRAQYTRVRFSIRPGCGTRWPLELLMLMFLVSRLLSQRRSCSIQQQQNPDTPIAVHRSLRRLAAHGRLRTVGGAWSGSSRRILSVQICTTVQPHRIRVSVSTVRCLAIRSVDPRSARFRPRAPPRSIGAPSVSAGTRGCGPLRVCGHLQPP